MLDLEYRTPPKAEFVGYKERLTEHKIHFDELNETQLRIYYTGTLKCSFILL
jgi:hypothetical protein